MVVGQTKSSLLLLRPEPSTTIPMAHAPSSTDAKVGQRRLNSLSVGGSSMPATTDTIFTRHRGAPREDSVPRCIKRMAALNHSSKIKGSGHLALHRNLLPLHNSLAQRSPFVHNKTPLRTAVVMHGRNVAAAATTTLNPWCLLRPPLRCRSGLPS